MLVEGVRGKEKSVDTGVPQGSPVSPLLSLLYTTPLYELIKEQGASASGFVDNITVYVAGEMTENSSKLSSILGSCCEWARSRSTEIDLGPKLGFIHFTKKKRKKRKKKRKIEKREKKKTCYCQMAKKKKLKAK